MALTPNTTYTLINAEGLGQGVGSVPTGTVVTLEEIHKEPQAGVAGDVVVSFVSSTVRVADEDVPVVRRISLALADFKRMFKQNAGASA